MSANAFPRYGFTSDNVAGASDAVIQAIVECQQGAAAPYGADPISQQLEAQLAELFECELKVFLVSTGSAANALCLASMVPPWERYSATRTAISTMMNAAPRVLHRRRQVDWYRG